MTELEKAAEAWSKQHALTPCHHCMFQCYKLHQPLNCERHNLAFSFIMGAEWAQQQNTSTTYGSAETAVQDIPQS